MTVVLNFESSYYGHKNGKIESKDENINSDVSVEIDNENIEKKTLLNAFKPSKNFKQEKIKLVIVDTHDSDDESVKEVLTNEEKRKDPIIQETFESFQTCNQQLLRRTLENPHSIVYTGNHKIILAIIFTSIIVFILSIWFIILLVKHIRIKKQ
ncbi:hypothetical protein M153_14700016541 [Pseudoloma neurophilia]|uniref:Uncharacterized protein n=1 Tax=Pseudoloma neurophilia TaxID=146866 RepID=A0A0R0M908_9MICR|nr:hypothetical protein M153_14700016541 [Pseudoloma neurophilia]